MRRLEGASGRRAAMRASLRAAALAGASLLALAPHAAAQDVIKPGEQILLRAPEVSYDSANGIVTASGRVEISAGGRVLLADEVVYNQKTGIVTARGNVSLSEPDGDVAFAEEIVVTDDFRDGVIDTLSILLADNSKLAAASGRRTGGNRTELRKVIFSPCRVCKDNPTPLWAIKADTVVHDKAAQRITYTGATFEFLGTPVAYLPYFEHADPSVKRKSGFLVPRIGSSTDLGYIIEPSYFWAPDPDWDVTVSPLLTTDEGQVLKGEYRQSFANGDLYLSGSIANIEERRIDGTGTGDYTAASHLFGAGRFTVDENWRWGFDVEATSSDTYMERYEISFKDRLRSNAFAEGRFGRSSIDANAYYFQGLRATDDVGTTPFILPLVEATWYPEIEVLGGTFKIDGNLLLLERTDGLDSRRLSASAEWRRTTYFDSGEVLSLFASVRGDVYHANGLNPLGLPGIEDDSVEARFLPMAGFDFRFPFVRPDEGVTWLIEPIVQVIAAPYGGNPDDIPNEDSASFEFDESNLFAATKFPGLDRWESGVRANVGARAAAYFDNGGLIEVLAGQNFRLREDSAFPTDSGLGDQDSDYVGRIIINPTPNISIVNRFRLDKETLSAQRNEVYLDTRIDMLDLSAGYLQLNDESVGLGLGAREEVAASGRFHFTEYWSFAAAARRDLEEGRMVNSRAGLIYEDECSAFEFTYSRIFTRDRDAEPNSSFTFRVRLKALGEDTG